MTPDLSQPLANLPDPLPIPMIDARSRPFDIRIRPPGSKSITNRALLLAALAHGTSTLRGALTRADDARVMLRAITQLGAVVDTPPDGGSDDLRITGVGGRWRVPTGGAAPTTLDLHNAGTATRFLAAAALLAPAGAAVIIDGDARMRQRPIGELVDALNALAAGGGSAGAPAAVTCTDRAGFPPIRVGGLGDGPGSAAGMPSVRFGRTQSSQFISAVLLIAPFLPRGLSVEFADAITSEPYINMTIRMLQGIGVVVEDQRPGGAAIRIAPQRVQGFALEIEPDASGATYFHAAAALFPDARVTIDGPDLSPQSPPRGSLQGDTGFVRILSEMGATVERVGGGSIAALRVTGPARLRAVDVDLADMPDTAMTAAVLCCFAAPTEANPQATSTLRGLRTLRVKETDRLEALRIELAKIGARVEIVADGADEALRITPPLQEHASSAGSRAVEFDTYNDHRMAMALALVGLRRPGIAIRNPGCVAKTYPGYWSDLARLLTVPKG